MNTKSSAREFIENIVGPLTMASMLLSLRQCDELTQVQFAKKLGISKQTLCDIEKSRKLVSPSRAARFAKKLGYPPGVFLKIALEEEFKKDGLRLKIKSVNVA